MFRRMNEEADEGKIATKERKKHKEGFNGEGVFQPPVLRQWGTVNVPPPFANATHH